MPQLISNFGVFIRSIGERTENLSVQSALRCVPESNIHVLRNYFPSFLVFKKMFEIAHEKQYAWYLGLDADTILRPDWFEYFEKNINNHDDSENVFRYHFPVKDKFVTGLVIQGNNIYNGRHTSLIIREYKKNIFLSRLGFINRLFTRSPNFYLKPETNIRNRMEHKYNYYMHKFTDLIGWHGFEQYYRDIFYRWAVRANRNPNLDKKYSFLQNFSENQSQNNDMNDWKSTYLGWKYGKAKKFSNIDGRIRDEFKKILASESIPEKSELNITLDEFYSSNPLI